MSSIAAEERKKIWWAGFRAGQKALNKLPKCPVCGSPVKGERRSKVYCSDSCRVKASRERKNGKDAA